MEFAEDTQRREAGGWLFAEDTDDCEPRSLFRFHFATSSSLAFWAAAKLCWRKIQL
jgi:hypothetical protein